MANKSKEKGTRAEYKIRDLLRQKTGLDWQRVPMSGAGHTKGDLYVPNEKNLYCIECKSYKEDHLSSKIIINKTNNLIDWWNQAIEQATKTSTEPILFYKWDRSKIYVGVSNKPIAKINYIYINFLNLYVCSAEDYLNNEKIKWIK